MGLYCINFVGVDIVRESASRPTCIYHAHGSPHFFPRILGGVLSENGFLKELVVLDPTFSPLATTAKTKICFNRGHLVPYMATFVKKNCIPHLQKIGHFHEFLFKNHKMIS